MLTSPTVTVLGRDPVVRRHPINSAAFQQDAILSFHGWQYAAYYAASCEASAQSDSLYVHLGRRQLPDAAWDLLVFDDYPQTTDDGHNTVQIGICPGDGTVHLAYDHHCDVLRYRHSLFNITHNPAAHPWKASLFTSTLNHLPGLPASLGAFQYVTYPRFFTSLDALSTSAQISSSSADCNLFFTVRDGKAGLGNDHLFAYSPAESSSTGRYVSLGVPLTGILSNPYVHGWDMAQGRIHVTWVYRDFVSYPGCDDPLDTKHKQQAGPNGAENNHDICYVYSEDQGLTWRNGEGTDVAIAQHGGTVDNRSSGIVAVTVPKGRGLTNQEAQTVDLERGVHILNRDELGDEGEWNRAVLRWKHHYRNPVTKRWSSTAIGVAKCGSRRGRLGISTAGDLLLILPDPEAKRMRIVRATKQGNYNDYEIIWTGEGLVGEPLLDAPRLRKENVLSLYTIRESDQKLGGRDVVVLDFDL